MNKLDYSETSPSFTEGLYMDGKRKVSWWRSLLMALGLVADAPKIPGFTIYGEYYLEEAMYREYAMPEIYADGEDLPALTELDYIAHYSLINGQWVKDAGNEPPQLKNLGEMTDEELEADIAHYEQKYGFSSEEFLRRKAAGEDLDDYGYHNWFVLLKFRK